jgi:hypothetical protein
MRSDVILACVASSAVALTGTSCSRQAFVDTTGEASNTAPYPAGPYGFEKGSTLYDYDFAGFAAPNVTTSTMQAMALSDFYNPHGKDPTYQPASPAEDDRLFPSNSAYASAGKPKPTVLLIQVGAVWCIACNEEAKSIFPGKHATYAPCGGEFLLNLIEGQPPGVLATPTTLIGWTTTYKIDYPVTIDPSGKLKPLWQTNALPENIIVDTTTMKIVEVFPGPAVSGLCGTTSYTCGVDADCQTCNAVCSNGRGACSTDADCTIPCQIGMQGGMCATDFSACTTDADCTKGATCQHECGDGTACAMNSDCAAKKCTPFAFWTTYESYLDKTRSGCTLH